ncbi:hypothetical protein [Thermoplasma acidophilum]|uniref:Exonuclease domain-containing protein n=1 Tax=Thermoplasma acidophilum (strain ATCC 25905 / DSM 1728 / JCM 9062 / NBRC 15155 / AMRC-C165) TaxID=273075 RepID=Q9HIG3_THEAC|nr:exonuclease domain-containing protein [Thermoplasma acidophilum]CAC12497.1 hypothetical protein [Thermoplasma acidophilum]
MIFIDTETTGLDPTKCSVISVGAVVYEDPSSRFYMEARPDPDAMIDDGALAVNGFTKEYLSSIANAMYDMLTTFTEWYASNSSDYTVAGYNIDFDISFLSQECLMNSVRMIRIDRRIDLKNLFETSDLYKGGRKRLDDLLMALGLGTERKPHNALYGALAEAEAYAMLVEKRRILPQDDIERIFTTND